MSRYFSTKLVELNGNVGAQVIDLARRFKRKVIGTDRHLLRKYFDEYPIKKLHIGSSDRNLAGWLNADIEIHPGVFLMDASREFPFPDGTFDYIFSEHMIEHIPYDKGTCLLRECHRILRPGGIIRIVTPDLAAVIGLYAEHLAEIQRKYLSYFLATFNSESFPVSAASAINSMFRQWGHQFIYDEQTLENAMCTAGFNSIKRKRLGASDYPELKNLENVQRYPPGLLDFESLALEARK